MEYFAILGGRMGVVFESSLFSLFLPLHRPLFASLSLNVVAAKSDGGWVRYARRTAKGFDVLSPGHLNLGKSQK
jgi:hypothetical protein